MKITRALILLFVITGFLACDGIEDVDCENFSYKDCDTVEPTWGEMKINLTINEENHAVPITVYYSQLEDTIIDYYDTVYSEVIYLELYAGDEYTVTAEYKSGNRTILAVDSDEIEKIAEEMCGETCWSVEDAEVNVELIY